MTHASLRAAQGDPHGARRLLLRILERSPADARAHAMLERLAKDRSAPAGSLSETPTTAAPTPGDPARLRAQFRAALGRNPPGAESRRRIGRLERWLARVARS